MFLHCTLLLYIIALFTLCKTEEGGYPRQRRGSFQSTYPVGNRLRIGGVDVNSYGKAHIPLQEHELYAQGIGDFINPGSYKPLDVSLNVDLSGSSPDTHLPYIQQIPQALSNSLEKPVQEPQEYVPPQSVGTAVIPLMPPPAVPVNAAASNVPADSGAVFLGSGALGVIDLGGGAYALGSGSLGYSGMRSNPRNSIRAPLLPPVQASPNLIPAAVPRNLPPQAPVPIDFGHPLLANNPVVDQNGYEYLPPNRVGFGTPIARLRPLKTTMAFATPSALQLPPPQFQPYPNPAPNYPTTHQIFGQRIPNLY